MGYGYNNYGWNGFQQQGAGINWVQGESGAKSYIVAPGSTALLMDSEAQVFYIKTADASGMPSMDVYDYKKREQKPSADLTALEARIAALEQAIMNDKGGKQNGK